MILLGIIYYQWNSVTKNMNSYQSKNKYTFHIYAILFLVIKVM